MLYYLVSSLYRLDTNVISALCSKLHYIVKDLLKNFTFKAMNPSSYKLIFLKNEKVFQLCYSFLVRVQVFYSKSVTSRVRKM